MLYLMETSNTGQANKFAMQFVTFQE